VYETSSDSSSNSDSDAASQADSEADVALAFAQALHTRSDAAAVPTEPHVQLQRAVAAQHSTSVLNSSSSNSSCMITSKGRSRGHGDVAHDVAKRHKKVAHKQAPPCTEALAAAF
jgi:hypothetical protein